jgi:hypothetical protein
MIYGSFKISLEENIKAYNGMNLGALLQYFVIQDKCLLIFT